MWGALAATAAPAIINWGSKLLGNTSVGQSIGRLINSGPGQAIGSVLKDGIKSMICQERIQHPNHSPRPLRQAPKKKFIKKVQKRPKTQVPDDLSDDQQIY